MKRIVLFMPYFGKLPNYFDLWLKSAIANESIDFCIITDLLDPKKSYAPNIRIKHMSFEEFKTSVQSKFDFKILINNYGRISQFRPALAYIFPEEVSGYDYWGYVECDLILGDVRKFLTDEILEQYEKFFKLGHFQLYKNNEKMNRLFMTKSKAALDYKYAFSHDVLFFEELLGMHNIAKSSGIKIYTENVFSDLIVRQFMFYRSNFGYPERPNNEACLFEYNNGKIYEYFYDQNELSKRETLYLHLQKRSMSVETDNLNEYSIVPNKFIDLIEPMTSSEFDKIFRCSTMQQSDYESGYNLRVENDKKKRMKNLSWVRLYFMRKRIVANGGDDLNGGV